MSYERLELIDGVTKWDTEKVQHLEDAIIKNENDIQKYHNDTIVEMQADWDQSDNTAKNYVKNRTHYKEVKEIIIAKGFETETYEGEGSVIALTNTIIPCKTVLNSKEEIEKLKVNINGQLATIDSLDYSQDFKHASWVANREIRINYFVNEITTSWEIMVHDKANLPAGEQFIIDIYTEQVEYMPLDEKYLPASVLEQPDWECNDTNDSAYIKNRTHYDYWEKGSRIYEYDADGSNQGSGLPHTFEVVPDEGDFLGGHGFFYNGLLFNLDSNWKMIGEEYDKDLGNWKTKYECQQIKHYPVEGDDILTMSAITYSQYDGDQGEYKYFVSIDCKYKGMYGISLYEAEMRSKTLDKRFLADFTVVKDWSVNDENAPSYIKNRPFYVEHSTAEPYEPIYHPIDEKFIPDTIARVTDLTNLDTKVAGDLEALESKVENKQIEEYFEGIKEVVVKEGTTGGTIGGTVTLDNLSNGNVRFKRPLNLKVVFDGIERYITDEEVTPESYGFSVDCEWDDDSFIELRHYDYEETKDTLRLDSPNFGISYAVYQLESGIVKQLGEEYIPDSIARAPKVIFNDIEEAPTASDFNTLLSILRESGILATK